MTWVYGRNDDMTYLNTKTAGWLRNEISHRNIGIEELVRFYLDRISKYDGSNGLNTIAELDLTIIQQAKNMDAQKKVQDLLLYGLPILIKDNIDVAGLHTTAGSLALTDNVAVTDAPVISNLRRQGAIILGKTNMTEFANYTTQNMPDGYSSRGGQVKNAYDRTKSPSGSSSGSAVAMSAGLCAAAVGTDTSFSIIGCATENGVTGLKPPNGKLSDKGIIPISRTLDSAGALTRDFSDAYMLYSGMCDKPLKKITCKNPKDLRIALNIFNLNEVSTAQIERYETLFIELRKAGVTISEISQEYTPYQRDIMRCEFKNNLEEYLLNSSAKMKTLKEIVEFYEANSKRVMKYGITYLNAALNETSGRLDDVPYQLALEERKKQQALVVEQLRGFDACIMTGPTNIMHFVGLPSVALKLCMADDNTPRGIILYGADEMRLYSAALTIERYCSEVTCPIL
jgi:amidase